MGLPEGFYVGSLGWSALPHPLAFIDMAASSVRGRKQKAGSSELSLTTVPPLKRHQPYAATRGEDAATRGVRYAEACISWEWRIEAMAGGPQP